MAFESLTDKLQNVFKNLRSKGRLTEEDVKAALKEVKMALLEADVNFKVVKQFVKSVEERAIGQDVMNGLNPGQMVIKIVNEEMIALMGSETTEIAMQPGKVFNRETLLENVWGYEYFGDVRTVDVTVRRLREKIEDNPATPGFIMTKRGVGYYFNK